MKSNNWRYVVDFLLLLQKDNVWLLECVYTSVYSVLKLPVYYHVIPVIFVITVVLFLWYFVGYNMVW